MSGYESDEESVEYEWQELAVGDTTFCVRTIAALPIESLFALEVSRTPACLTSVSRSTRVIFSL